MPSGNTIYVKVPVSTISPDQTMGYAVLPNGDIEGILGLPPQVGSVQQAHGVDPLILMQRSYPSYDVGWAEHDAGVYTPRFYRGNWANNWPGMLPPMNDMEASEYTTAREQEDILSIELTDIARVVRPEQNTKHVYGSKIRNLLLAACTEVESQMKGILKANGTVANSKHFNTTDYVKLHRPLRLEEYSLTLSRYRDYGEIWPFQGWNATHSTTSLPWYDAYNATKHDRELNFNRGTLEHAIAATGALAILLLAQYGPSAARPAFLDSFFTAGSRPFWDNKDRTHAPPTGGSWTPLLHTF